MHPALRQEFENLKKLADKKGKILGLMESNLEQVIFISSDISENFFIISAKIEF